MKYKVIVADDEPIMRKAMQTLIDWEANECRLVCVASNGQEVMAYLEEEIPDILILDIKMPGMNGIELAQYVYEKKIPTRVILLTGYADFAYAQSAVKYNAIDYVIKSGEFGELIQAIEKAKADIEETRKENVEQYHQMKKENFIKSIMDGSLYLPEEIQRRAQECGIKQGKSCVVIKMQFQGREDRQRTYVHRSLLRFLGMVFEKQLIYGMFVKKNEMVILLSDERNQLLKTIPDACVQVVEMMEKFMGMEVFLGISNYSSKWETFSELFDEAEYAVRESVFYHAKRIKYYKEVEMETKEVPLSVRMTVKEMQDYMKKGMKQASLETLQKVLDSLKCQEYAMEDVLELGVEIKTVCDSVLAKYNGTLGELIPSERSLSHKIQKCTRFSDFECLLEQMIDAAAGYVNAIVNKREMLLYETEKFIDANYKKNITVSDVARNVGVSLSYLSRIYKESKGVTLIHYINMKKIDAAKKYLGNTDMKIYEIAEALGFENTTYFSYFFKKSTGISPKEYQKNMNI